MEINGRHYVLLPKLNRVQFAILKERLEERGFKAKGSAPIVARSPEITIHIEAPGLCWSSSDPSDYILPLMPEVLGCRREHTGSRELLGLYLQRGAGNRLSEVRFNPRLESLGNWNGLRSTGGCGLAPDECVVVRSMLSKSRGLHPAVTDFAIDGSIPFVLGRRLYYRGKLPAADMADTLRVVGGEKGRRNSYLPRDGLLSLMKSARLEKELVDSFESLGEWCPFTVS